MSQLRALDEIRERAARRLEGIAEKHGRASDLYRKCQSLWDKREEDAFASLVHGDFENAAVVLERGLNALVYGPEALKKGQLALNDVVQLMGAS